MPPRTTRPHPLRVHPRDDGVDVAVLAVHADAVQVALLRPRRGGWRGDRPPHVPLSDTVVYEAHVRGLTRRMPGVRAALRGTYAGLAHPAAVEHLVRLGVTTVELLPVHAIAAEAWLARRGAPNYW